MNGILHATSLIFLLILSNFVILSSPDQPRQSADQSDQHCSLGRIVFHQGRFFQIQIFCLPSLHFFTLCVSLFIHLHRPTIAFSHWSFAFNRSQNTDQPSLCLPRQDEYEQEPGTIFHSLTHFCVCLFTEENTNRRNYTKHYFWPTVGDLHHLL